MVSPHGHRFGSADGVSWLFGSVARIFVVGEVVAPLSGQTLLAVGQVLGHREVGHEAVRGRVVPVPLPGGSVDCVAWTDLQDLTATALHESAAVDDVQGLAVDVAMPRVCAPGANRTMPTRSRDGGSPWAIMSTQTSPVKVSAGPLTVGR
jgi:hypothetical protein